MPFDGRNFGNRNGAASGGSSFEPFITSRPSHRFDVDATRPTAQNTPLFGMDGAEWRGFFLALTGLLEVVLGMAAVLLSAVGY